MVYASQNNINIDCSELDDNICSYLASICFPHGVTELSRVKKNFPEDDHKAPCKREWDNRRGLYT